MRKEVIRIFATMAVVFLVVTAPYAGGKTTPFVVSSTTPANLAIGVAEDQVLTVTFNQDLNCTTVTTSTFTLQSVAKHPGAVAGTVTCSGMVATFTPSSPLAANTNYTATITNKVKDENGQTLLLCFVWCFKTGCSLAAPTVTAVTPLNKATGVALNTKITAAFDQAMNPQTINSSTFTLTAPGNKAVKGKVTYDTTNNIATFTPSANLLTKTTYTATITSCVTNLMCTEMASNFVWTFTTGAAPDITPPTVISTIPVTGPPAAIDVPLNQIITATFSKAMTASTITTPPQFTLQVTSTSAPVSGVVTYAAVGNTATFTPNAALTASTEYTATILTGVTDLAGNHLVTNYVWTFTTGAAVVNTPPTVLSTSPANSGAVCINGAINATFSEAMDFATFTTGTFYVTGPASAPVLGTLSIDITGTIVTFTPTSNLTSGNSYTATITTGVTDLFANHLATNEVWSFTASGTCVAAVPLNSVAPFGGFGGGAGMTNSGTNTVVNGDIGTTGASSTMTGFHDLTVLPYTQFTHGCIYTEDGGDVGEVTGEIYTAPGTSIPSVALGCTNEGTGPATTPGTTFYIATQAAADALAAYNALAALPTTGPDPSASGNLGGKTIPPGVYASASGAFSITGTDLTLDAQGNANAVWVFKMSTGGLTVGLPANPRSVILINGAQAKNVFWQVYSAATINGAGGGTMVGTIIAQAGVTFSTVGNSAITTLNGRAIGLAASVTLVNTVINVPAP
jgi:hypothetical protein